MTLIELLAVLFFSWLLFTPRGGSRRRPRCKYVKLKGGGVVKLEAPPGPRPVTPEPDYICVNCGMLIRTGHGHTREECDSYKNDPLTPDLTLKRTMLEKGQPGRNDPKVRKPYYLEPGTFFNWGAGK